jgi:hypothetical protein
MDLDCLNGQVMETMGFQERDTVVSTLFSALFYTVVSCWGKITIPPSLAIWNMSVACRNNVASIVWSSILQGYLVSRGHLVDIGS